MQYEIDVQDAESLVPSVVQEFWATFEILLSEDDGAAAKSHLDAGRPIYFCEDAYPDALIRKWGNGLRELVQVDERGVVTSVTPL